MCIQHETKCKNNIEKRKIKLVFIEVIKGGTYIRIGLGLSSYWLKKWTKLKEQ